MPACWRKFVFALFALALVPLCALAVGCALVEPHAVGRSPLKPARPSPDSVTLEIFFARCPLGDPRLNGPLWSAIDEQRFTPELRRQLANSGFRAGVVDNHLPPELVQLLKLSEAPAPQQNQPLKHLEKEPTVTLRRLQTRSGQRNEIIASKVYDELPLLTREASAVRGRTYYKAEGRFALEAFPVGDGRVRVELVPELHHGQQRPHWTGSDGVLRLDASRPKQVFDELKLQAVLAPGEMIVMTTAAERPGSMGHYFFTEPTGEAAAQKLLIIRLSHASQDELYDDQPAKVVDLGFE